MNSPVRCAVDASVVVKLFVAEEESPLADALFMHLKSDPEAQIYAPSFLYAECANVLWKHVRRFGYDPRESERGLDDLMRLSIKCVDVREVIREAYQLALKCDITAYDACYAATAIKLDVPLVTTDARLARKLAGMNPDILILGRFAIPPVVGRGQREDES